MTKYRITGKKPEEDRAAHSLNTIIDVIEADDREKAHDIYRRRYKGFVIVQSEPYV